MNFLMNFIMSFLRQPMLAAATGQNPSAGEQKNASFWVFVAVMIVVIAAFYAACIAWGANFTGEFNFIGFGFKVQCG